MPFQTMTCPSCANEIQIPTERDTVHCAYCGAQLNVRNLASSGAPDPQNVLDTAVQFLESNNFKEADNLLTKVLEYDPNNALAWFGKALISSSPTIEIKLHSSNVHPALAQHIVQVQSYILKASRCQIENEVIRKKLARLFLAVAIMRLKGFDGARNCDSARSLLYLAVEEQRDENKRHWSLDTCSWLHISVLALTASYVLEHSEEVADLLSYSYEILSALPYIQKGWSSTEGCEAMLFLERKIKADHPEWVTRPTRPTPPSAKPQAGCATVFIFLLFLFAILR